MCPVPPLATAAGVAGPMQAKLNRLTVLVKVGICFLGPRFLSSMFGI